MSRHEGDPLGFGRELDELRAQRSLSWEELARRSGVSATYLKDMAKGRRGHGWPSDDVVERIALALDVAPDHFRITRARALLARPAVIDNVYARLRRPQPQRRPPRRAPSS